MIMPGTGNVKNIKELAERLNLSITTVSRVLNGKSTSYRISAVTSQRVIDAARELNYSPNRIARGLKLEKTDTIGLIIPDVANAFFASIAKIIEIESRKNGYSIILCDSLDNEETELELLQLMNGRKVDGIIIAPVGHKSIHIEQVQKSGTPVVVVDRFFPKTTIPYISTDNYSGAFKAVDHIISMGHTRIACIQGGRDTSSNIDRVRGYMDALKKYNIDPDPSLMPGDSFGEENGYIQTRILMSKNNRPTAIFALSNLISLGVLRALNEIQLTIPQDVSLLSFDEQPYSAFLASPMTTIEQRREEIARMALNVLLGMIRKGTTEDETKILLEPRLIIRKSIKNMHI
jgi:LacI family transcriptional regulator